jgi:putative peptidoglycan lipid II flippase
MVTAPAARSAEAGRADPAEEGDGAGEEDDRLREWVEGDQGQAPDRGALPGHRSSPSVKAEGGHDASHAGGVASAAVLIGLGNVASRLLGLVRELVIAALFGATGSTSAFRTATRVSTAVYDLLLSGATTSALVPVFSEYAATGKTADLGRIVSTFLNLTVCALGLIVALLVLEAPGLVPGLGAEPAFFDLAVDLTRITLPSIVLLGVSGILTAVLYAQRSFAITAMVAAVYNVGIIAAALALHDVLSIYSLAIGLGLGALLQILIQLPSLRRLNYRPIIDLRHPGVRLVLRLYLPVFVGMLASYAVVVIDTYLAWQTGPDSVAAMAFATTLIQFPLGLVGAAASLAVLPSLSRLALRIDEEGEGAFVGMLLRGLKLVVLLIVPIGVVMVLLREPLVAALFQRQAFDRQATERTALALLAYSPQLPFVVVDQLLIVAYYARKQTRTPVLVGFGCIFAYLAVALTTYQSLGMPGLALANAVQNSAHAVVLYVLLARSFAALRAPSMAAFLGKVVVGAGVAALAVWGGAAALAQLLGTGGAMVQLGLIAALGLIAGAIYLALLRLLKVEELTEITALARRVTRRG